MYAGIDTRILSLNSSFKMKKHGLRPGLYLR